MIRKRDEKADKLVKLYLSFFTLSRLILIAKKSNYQYSSIVKPGKDISLVLQELSDRFTTLIERYIPKVREIPLITGLKWLPMWSASPVPYKFVPGKMESPFYRSIWDLL